MRLIVKDLNVGNIKNQTAQTRENTRYGFWGVVEEVDSTKNTVDVKMGGGLVLKDIPVATTNEWVCEYKDKDYVAGARNLPPRNARVFVMMPTGTYEGAFVLCSGLSVYEDIHKKAFMANEKSEKHDKDKSRQIVRQGKWESLYNYENGSYELKSPTGDEGITLKINDDKDKKEVNIKAFGSLITIDKDGNIQIVGEKDSNVEVQGNAELKVNGNIKIAGEKDSNVEVQGNAELKVNGNIKIAGEKDSNVEVQGNAELKVNGNIKIAGEKDSNVEVQGNADIKAKGKINIDGSVINLNGSSNSSVKAEELQKQLEVMKLRIDGIIQAIKTSPVVPQDGGAMYKSSMTTILTGLISEDFSNIINSNVKHGS